MSTEFFNDQWRIPSNENQNKVSNYSCEFDGTSDKIEFGNVNSFERTDSFSGSCWVNLDSISIQFLLTKMPNSSPFRGYLMYIVNGRLQFAFNANFPSNRIQVNSVGTISAGNWNHLVFTYDGSSLRTGVKLYINGIEQSVTFEGPVSVSGSTINTADFQISGRGTSSLVDGKIDQVSVFDYELLASQVATLYGGGTALTNPMSLSPAPVSYYQLGDQSVDNGANYLVPNNSLSDYVFDFDGSNDFIDCGNDSSLQFSSSFSISAWVKINDTSNNAIISKDSSGATGSGYHIDFRSGNQVHAWAYNATNKVIKTGLSINVWYHIVFVFESSGGTNGTQSLYVNAQTPATSSITNFAASTVKNLRIGNSEAISGFNTNGLISNVSIFNSNLSSAQITTIYNNGSPNDISSLNPVSWWKLNAQDTFDGTDWTVTDYGSGSNDGTSSGMTSANLVVSDLQHTSGYSPYALNFDGVDDVLNLSEIDSTGTKTYSCWINPTVSGNNGGFLTLIGVDIDFVSIALWQSEIQVMVAKSPTANNRKSTVQTISANQWYHIAVIKSTGSVDNIYINGVNQTLAASGGWNSNNTPTQYKIGDALFPTSFGFSGSISNVATFNAALTSTEITEIYNQGVPSNLNTFSGTKPTAWWQLGSNSSFNPNPTGTEGTWTCLDEIGTNNAASSTNMTNDDITNGVGYSANGLGTSSIDIVGDAPYSSANGLSENMDVLDRVTDVPS